MSWPELVGAAFVCGSWFGWRLSLRLELRDRSRSAGDVDGQGRRRSPID